MTYKGIGEYRAITLTTGADTGAAFTGGSGNDIFNAPVGIVFDSNGNPVNTDTLQAVDVLNGGGGIDTLNVTSKGGTVALGSLSSIEVMNVKSLGALTIDSSNVSDLTNLNITEAAGAVSVTASASADVSVALQENGAASVLANTVDGGKNVTVTATKQGATSSPDTITIGGTTAAAGDVVVTSTGAAYTTSTAASTLGAISVTGGKTITVTQKAAADSSAAAADTTNAIITQGDVTIAGNADTTMVTVKQDAAVTAVNASFTTGGVTETASVKFSALSAGQTIILAGLTFTASTAMTAAEAAAAFANLVNNAAFPAPASIGPGDTQGGAAASKGTYTGIFSGWTSGAANGDTVVFTSTTPNTNVTDLANTGTGTVTITTTDGKAHDAGAAGGKMGVANGTVSITDTNSTIKTITLDGYTDGSTTTTSVLETLNLSNGKGGGTLTIADTADTLALNVEKVGASTSDAALTFTAAPLTLNVKSTGNNYVNLTAAATKTLNVSGTGVFDADATDLAALETVTVTGAAGVKLNAGVADTVKSVDTTGTTGTTTITIEGGRATYAGGAGVDIVTLVTDTALTKAIDLGGGDDTLIFGVSVTGSSATLTGGAGTDTLGMTVANADALDAAPQTFYTGFERLLLTTAAGDNDDSLDTVTIDLEKLGFTNYVITNGTTLDTTTANKSDVLVLDNLASGGTVVTVAAAAGADTKQTINVKDAATGTSDVVNFVLKSASSLNAGVLTVADVETVNITSADDDTTSHTNTLTLTANKATSVTVTGNAGLTLSLTGSTKVTSVDGSAMTGALTVTAVNTTSATTLKGGSGNDVLIAATGTTADILMGGAGNDVLVANAGLTTMTGGAGNDVFRIATASLNVNSYATITDFTAGDLIQFAGATSFQAAKITLGDTAVFQDYANAAMNAIGANAVAWFQFGGNTYIVMDKGTTDSTTFINGEDYIVKLTGLVDLTNASFNNTYETIALV